MERRVLGGVFRAAVVAPGAMGLRAEGESEQEWKEPDQRSGAVQADRPTI